MSSLYKTTTMKYHHLGDAMYVCRDKKDMSKIRFRNRRTKTCPYSYFTMTDPQLTRLLKVAKDLKADLQQQQQQQQQQRCKDNEDETIKKVFEENELLREIRQTGERIVQIATEGIASTPSEPASLMDSS